ncbi:MAG: energy transducer TonB [Chitinispirillaceae bacterium]|nr:energy transducer TonB [Chitinispirillaceae bacterium]
MNSFRENDLCNPGGAAIRWLVSGVLAGTGVLVFLLLVIRPAPLMNIIPPPLIELGYVLLPPEPREPPKPVVVQKAPPIPQPEVPPVPETPLESFEEPVRVTAEVTSAPAAPRPQPKAGEPLRLQSVAQLDNTEFSPLVNIKPLYPPVALKANIEGYVNVDLLVDEKGFVESFSIVDVAGHPSFGNETAKVIGRWRFPPPRINGKKVKVNYVYRVNFTLD